MHGKEKVYGSIPQRGSRSARFFEPLFVCQFQDQETSQAVRVPLTSRWYLGYREVLRCLRLSDLVLSDSMPQSSRICTGFIRCPSPLPREWRRFPGRAGIRPMKLARLIAGTRSGVGPDAGAGRRIPPVGAALLSPGNDTRSTWSCLSCPWPIPPPWPARPLSSSGAGRQASDLVQLHLARPGQPPPLGRPAAGLVPGSE